MEIALIGYGKMGKEIEKMAVQRGHHISGRFDSKNPPTIKEIQHADVAIEFSNPNSAVENILMCFEAEVPVVVGTTGWYDEFDRIAAVCKNKGQSLFTATNFSIGVNILFEVNRVLARLMDDHEEYIPSIHEIHHVHKKDAPSGTAITIAEGIIGNIDKLSSWELNGNPNSHSLSITAERTGEVPGTHIIRYESPVDIIELHHLAKGRQGFVKGAILAAEWLKNKKGVFNMKDLLTFEGKY